MAFSSSLTHFIEHLIGNSSFIYNPYVQARSRIDQLKRLGHSVDKVWSVLCLELKEFIFGFADFHDRVICIVVAL
ncbi:hypothetical protein DVH24_008573 [Malus domestica]|uniref:Uncharacterized protein n=1 Tax=Malus domestica TaxID=3750 RepID=A0A498JQC4_MALDO|nr:hypothetical protein DVH24_008573 [Malus domestica]